DLAPELRAQRDELGRLHRARVVHGKLQDRLDPPGARRHDGDPCREEEGLVQAMRHEDHGLACPAPDVEEPFAHEHARLLVEGTERLVHQEDLRVDGERAADRDALLHAPGELTWVLLREALEAERAEERRRGRGHESWRISRAMTSRWISDVPSPISVSLASRKIRSTGNSVM